MRTNEPTLGERFWAKVTKRDPRKCWNWNGYLTRGYGSLWCNRKHCPAHRVSWEIHNGVIPDGIFVLHKCDNRRCVNPGHLFLGTSLDNVRDALAKGRLKKPPINDFRGERSPVAKLTESNVREIRARKQMGEASRSIALDFSVTVTAINLINRRERWAHLV